MLAQVVAVVCLFWYIGIAIVGSTGYIQIYRYYRRPHRRAAVEARAVTEIPHVTIIRPVKGLEPALYECLASTFRQTYPASKLTVRFCVSDRQDPSFSTLEKLIQDFPSFDAQILVEEEDSHVQRGDFGPNPKIRNMSRAYREARGDLTWIIDCNVWVAEGVCGRMVDKLCGYSHQGPQMPYKFVHLLPLSVDVSGFTGLLHNDGLSSPASSVPMRIGGGRLDEMFLGTAHGKFYTAINTVLIAPCIVGKSNMFRKSHLDALTSNTPGRLPGIDYFSENICEDHLIGDMLWKQKVPEEANRQFGKHSMVWGDFAIQPIAGMSLPEYVARRVRWLRVRKFTVTFATFVEPGTESLLCSLYGAYAVTTVAWFHDRLGMPQTWSAFVAFWLVSVIIWGSIDRTFFHMMHSMDSIHQDSNTPHFARTHPLSSTRPLKEWVPAWLGREALALPIWVWAFYCGTSVTWRGQRFRVGMDMRVHSLDEPALKGLSNGHEAESTLSKARRE